MHYVLRSRYLVHFVLCVRAVSYDEAKRLAVAYLEKEYTNTLPHFKPENGDWQWEVTLVGDKVQAVWFEE